MKKHNFKLLFLIGSLAVLSTANAQRIVGMPGEVAESKKKHAWEIGVGGSVYQFSRVDLSSFVQAADNFKLGLQLRHSVMGSNLYVAKELNPHFFLDLQATAGFTTQYIEGKEKQKMLYMVGFGLQWRFGDYFESSYIDPFLRVGVSYMKKNFSMRYKGTEGELPEEMSWVLENFSNKDGVDRDELFPVSFGAGMNAWLNDNFGIGFQGDYLLMPYGGVANSLQGTVRLIWRIGGNSKKGTPPIQYVEVEKIVEAEPVIIEKIVEVPAMISENSSTEICDLFNNIYFEFDKSVIRTESEPVLDKLSQILIAHSDRKYLITGYTDILGSVGYNIQLSRRRAAAVIEALIKRGVPSDIIKSRGVGKNISYAPVHESHIVREGDRKVTVEIISNMDYWNFLPDRDY